MPFVVFDGPDGSGKTTQIHKLKSVLEEKQQKVLTVREPGQTALGEALRELLLNSNINMNPVSEAFLFNAARCELVEEVVEPALNDNHWVISDRFYPSTIVYQAIAGGGDLNTIESLCHLAVRTCQPDHVLILDVPLWITRDRVGTQKDRIESRDDSYHEKIRTGFLDQAKQHNWPVIDASQNVDAVHQDILKALNLS